VADDLTAGAHPAVSTFDTSVPRTAHIPDDAGATEFCAAGRKV